MFFFTILHEHIVNMRMNNRTFLLMSHTEKKTLQILLKTRVI